MLTKTDSGDSPGREIESCGRLCFCLRTDLEISEVSPRMLEMLGVSDDAPKWLRHIQCDPSMILPEESGRRLLACAAAARDRREAVLFNGELTTIDRRLLPVSGTVEGEGPPEDARYAAILCDTRDRLARQAAAYSDHYVDILKPYCQWICEMNLAAGTAQCLYSRSEGTVKGMHVSLKDILSFRIRRQVAEADRERIWTFFKETLIEGRETPYHASLSFNFLDGENGVAPYQGLMIALGADRFLFCGLPKPGDGAGEHPQGRMVGSKNRTAQGHVVDIITFDSFNVLVDGVPVFFRSEKSKELLALLADRRGGYATSQSLISYLWENESANEVTYSRLRKVAMRLRNTLKEYGVEDIVENISGKRRIVAEKVNCDLFDYLALKKADRPRFCGNYLPDYSWSEFTHGELLSDK